MLEQKNRSVTVGGQGYSYSFYGASTTNVISYAGNSNPAGLSGSPDNRTKQTIPLCRLRDLGVEDLPERYWDSYWYCREKSGLGKSVLLKDGSFEDYDTLISLTPNEAIYARTADGLLRIKTISVAVGFGNNNRDIRYGLYSYLPQTPDFEVGEDIVPYGSSMMTTNSSRQRAALTERTNYLVEVPIEFKNTEGCDYIIAEQVDSDWPIPYYTYVDPSPGYYYTIVDTRYPSTLALYYENDNGETVGDTITIDLSSAQATPAPHYSLNIIPDGSLLRYNIVQSDMNETSLVKQFNSQYSIIGVANGLVIKEGRLNTSSGSINVANLPEGTYALSVQIDGQLLTSKWTKR